MSKREQALALADALEKDKWHVSAVTMQSAADLLRQWPEQPSPRLPENGMILDGTTPFAQPEAQPLTDAQVSSLWAWSGTSEAEQTATTQQHAFARAIEAAHGITGGTKP